MKCQGNVRGAIYPVTQIPYVKPEVKPNQLLIREDRKCVVCGKSLEGTQKQKYCSMYCKREFERKKRRQRG